MDGVLTDTEGRRIRLLEPLGKGGFGVVYLAEVFTSGGLASRLAVKLANQDLMQQPELVARARDEARLMSQLNHDHVVRVHGLTELGGRAAVLMEYVEGVDCGRLLLASHEARGGGLPPSVVADIIERSASALHAAWTTISPQTSRPLHVVHRDIKPSNILLSGTGVVKVMDFGVARAEFDREARTESVQFGTWRYMAPERLLENHAGPESDIFSLGATMWEISTGRPMERMPLAEQAFEEALARLQQALPPSSGVVELLAEMMAFDRQRRPTAAQVEARLAELDLEGPSLRRYARSTVPALVEAGRGSLRVDEEVRDFTSTIEDQLSEELLPASMPPPPSRAPLFLGAGFALLAVVGVGALALSQLPEPTVEPDELQPEEPLVPVVAEPAEGSPPALVRVKQELAAVKEDAFARCHAQSTEFPDGEVEWTLRFTVLRDGSVANPLLEGGLAPQFERCVLAALAGLRFEAPGEELVLEETWTLPPTAAPSKAPRPSVLPPVEVDPAEPPSEATAQPTFVITQNPVRVKLKSIPFDAAITVNGKVYSTFAEVDLMPGRYTFQAVWSDPETAGRMTCEMDITANTKAIKMLKDTNKCLSEQ